MCEDFPTAFVWFVGGFVVALIVVGLSHGPCESHKDIIEAGCGEYVIVDQATGRTEFQLKEMK